MSIKNNNNRAGVFLSCIINGMKSIATSLMNEQGKCYDTTQLGTA